MIIELEKSKNVHSITRTKRGKSNSSGFDREKAKKDIPQGSIINYDLSLIHILSVWRSIRFINKHSALQVQ